MVSAENILKPFIYVSRCEAIFDSEIAAQKYAKGKGQVFVGRMYRYVDEDPHDENVMRFGRYWKIPLGIGYAFCKRCPKHRNICHMDICLETDMKDPRLLSNKEDDSGFD